MGLLPGLAPTFAIRRGDARAQGRDRGSPAGPSRPHVVAQLDANLELLRGRPRLGRRPGASQPAACSASRAGEMAVLAYLLLKGTGRRVGEVASLHLECLDVDEHGKAGARSTTTTRRCAWAGGSRSPTRRSSRRSEPSSAG